jgi:serine/threonine protein kinase
LDGKYKICDFGFSKRTSAKDMTLKSVKGTPIYMAPELIKEEDYTCAVDIWALGIILFEVLLILVNFISYSMDYLHFIPPTFFNWSI